MRSVVYIVTSMMSYLCSGRATMAGYPTYVPVERAWQVVLPMFWLSNSDMLSNVSVERLSQVIQSMFQLSKQKGSFQGIDTIDVCNFGDFSFCSHLTHMIFCVLTIQNSSLIPQKVILWVPVILSKYLKKKIFRCCVIFLYNFCIF